MLLQPSADFRRRLALIIDEEIPSDEQFDRLLAEMNDIASRIVDGNITLPQAQELANYTLALRAALDIVVETEHPRKRVALAGMLSDAIDTQMEAFAEPLKAVKEQFPTIAVHVVDAIQAWRETSDYLDQGVLGFEEKAIGTASVH